MSRTDPRPHYGEHRPRLLRNGYVAVYSPRHPLAMRDGYVLEHRMVAWDAGLLTDRSQQVHHINGDRTDNRLKNLEVTTNGEHQRRHLVERGTVTNQFGTWTVGRSTRERNRENYLRQKAKGNR